MSINERQCKESGKTFLHVIDFAGAIWSEECLKGGHHISGLKRREREYYRKEIKLAEEGGGEWRHGRKVYCRQKKDEVMVEKHGKGRNMK